MKNLLKIYKTHFFWLLLGFFLSLAAYLASIALVSTSGWFITAMGIAGVTGTALNYFTPAAFIRACAIIRTGGRYLERLVTHDATLRVLESLRLWLYKQIEFLPPLDFQKVFRSGDLLNRLKNDIDSLDRFYLSFILPVSVSVSSVLIIISVLFHYAPVAAIGSGLLMLLCLIVVPVLAFLTGRKAERMLVTAIGSARADLSSQLQGLRELMILDTKKSCIGTWDAHISEIASCQNRINRSLSFAQSLILFCANISLLVGLLLLLPQIDGRALESAIVVMILMLSWSSFDELTKLPAAIQSLPQISRSAGRVFELERPVPKQSAIPLPTDNFSLSFKNVSFAYNGGRSVLCDLSFDLKSGGKLAVVGPTGSGKTTLTNLLFGFVLPNSGSILINGIEASVFSTDEILRCFSVVQQRPYLFDRTMEDNIRIAKPDASQDEIIRVCDLAGIHDFIESLPDGYKTYVGENGLRLSGGQIKRIALARALLKDAPCLVLDEVGEGLDYKMEEEIVDRILDSARGKTIIMITHRKEIAEKFSKILDLTKTGEKT